MTAKLFQGLLMFAMTALPMVAEDGRGALEARAAQFYARNEWPSARAAYTTLVHDCPGNPEILTRGIVSSLMDGSRESALETTLAGVDHKVPIDTIFSRVFRETISLGENSMYEQYLLNVKAAEPWMSRVVNRRLLEYYVFRDDGENIVDMATALLEATPDNMLFLPSLAYGQLLSGDMEGMVATNKRILELDPSNADALLYLSNFYYNRWKSGDMEAKDAAKKYVGRAMRIRSTPRLENMLAELN